MRFGINFFPTVAPHEKSGAQFYDEALALCERADALGYSSVKIVEHYFNPYGGYSPDPVTFLAAVSQRTRRIRLITGAVIPAFNHPIKLAGKLAMLDNLSHGRLDVGFARAFLPVEFDAFQVSMDESRARFEEGIAACLRLWTEEDVVWRGRFHQFGPVTLLPRVYQRPHPPVWIAAVATPQSFEWAGQQGYHLMIVPYLSRHEDMQRLLALYRDAWRAAGHPPGAEQVQMSFHAYVCEDGTQARREARAYMDDYLAKFIQAAAGWNTRVSDQYKGYEKTVEQLRAITYERVLADTKAFIGDPDEVAAQVRLIRDYYGAVEPSMQITFGNMPYERALRTLELFAQHVMPRFQAQPASTAEPRTASAR
jgi:natural product biosynthesis luciferase-like monooxygenase protein